MTAKHPKTAPAPLREQISTYLTHKGEATAKDITKHTSEANFPSRVLNELNKMRTDALVECEKRKGKGNEYWYWLVSTAHTNAAQNGVQPQPEVGQNTGSDGSAVVPCSAEAVAVQEPAPAPAAPPSVGPVAEDDMSPEDPALLASANRMLTDRLDRVAHVLRGCGLPKLANVSGSEDLQAHTAALAGAYQMAAAQLDAAKLSLSKLATTEQKRLETTTELTRALKELDAIREHLAPFSGDIDPSDMTEVELAAAAAISLVNLRRTAKNAAETAIDVLDAARSYVVRVPKRRPRVIGKPEKAREAALAAVRNGAARADVFALVEVGTARRGAEWRGGQ